jgi:hypothetical protein
MAIPEPPAAHISWRSGFLALVQLRFQLGNLLVDLLLSLRAALLVQLVARFPARRLPRLVGRRELGLDVNEAATRDGSVDRHHREVDVLSVDRATTSDPKWSTRARPHALPE